MKNEQDELNLANQLCFAIYDSNRLFTKFYQKALKSFELTYPQYIVLLSLWEQDRQSLKDLSEQLHLKSNTLTPLLKRLEEHGWIERNRPSVDKRQLEIVLTAKAKNQEEAIHTAISECIGHQLEPDIKGYQEALATVLKINSGLEQVLND
ncbi:MAG: MarR family winged helix-turn-helix transcriptional regulator [Enterococcus sp.]